jgi:hypothetical protein
VRGSPIARPQSLAAVALLTATLAGAASPSIAEGIAASETIFPATTRGWLSVPDARGLRQRFDRSPYGQLLADPAMKAFVDHVRAEITENGKQRLAKLGLTLEDLEPIPGGEVAVAAIEAQPGRLATVLLVDTTGHEAEAKTLVETITQRLVERRAEVVTIAGAPPELTVYRLPPDANDERREGPVRERRVAFALGGSALVVGDDAQQVGQAFSIVATGRKDSLAATPAFAGVMNRCAEQGPLTASPIRWFVDPLPFAKAYRETNPPREKRKGPDYVEILGRQGFDAVRGIGGVVVFGDRGHALRHATMIWAPPLSGRDPQSPESYDLAARMLRFPNADRLVAPDWVPRDVTGWSALQWDLGAAFAASETLVDDIVGDRGVFDDVIASLKEDPDGPQIDVENDLVAALGSRVSIITDHADPTDLDAERLVIAIEAVDEPRVAATIAKVMDADKDMERKEIAGHVVWELVDRTTEIPELQIETPGLGIGRGRDDDGRRRRQRIREKEEKLLPHSSVTVAKGHLFIASHRDVLERVLVTPGGVDALAAADDFAVAMGEIDRLLPAQTALKSFGREDETILPAYELLRQGSMPKSQSVFGQLLNGLLGDGTPGSVREQRLDGSTLPEFERIRRYFGTAAMGMQSVDDGWFLTGLSLPRTAQEPEVARSPDTTAVER